LSSGTNFFTAVLAARLLTPDAYGSVVIALSVAYSAIGIGRALVGDALLSFSPELHGTNGGSLIRGAMSASGGLGLISGALCAVAALSLSEIRSALLVIAACIFFAMIQDASRYAFLARHRPDLALACDGVWVGAQVLGVAGLILLDDASPEGVLATWGLGAAAGATFGVVVGRFGVGSPLAWVRQSRRLTGWLLGAGVLGQLQAQATIMIVAVAAGKIQLAGFRSVQLLVLMPVAALLVAAAGLVVPRLSESALGGDRSQLRTRIASLCWRFGLLSVAASLVLLALGPSLLSGVFGGSYDQFSPVLLPFAASVVILAVTAPLSAGLRALRQGAALFIAQLAMTMGGLPLIWLGAERAGARGAAWGVTGAVLIQLTMTASLLRAASRRSLDDPAAGVVDRRTGV
jgi:O-antigen/teichoic acid export membrane protein